jgi:hypothetical protein
MRRLTFLLDHRCFLLILLIAATKIQIFVIIYGQDRHAALDTATQLENSDFNKASPASGISLSLSLSLAQAPSNLCFSRKRETRSMQEVLAKGMVDALAQ